MPTAFRLAAFVVCVSCCAACHQRRSATTAPDVWSDGRLELTTRYEFHRGESLEKILAAQPSGSMDAVSADMTGQNYVVVIVDVIAKPLAGNKVDAATFTTTFDTSTGKQLSKTWKRPDRTSTHARALLVLPEDVVAGHTQLSRD